MFFAGMTIRSRERYTLLSHNPWSHTAVTTKQHITIRIYIRTFAIRNLATKGVPKTSCYIITKLVTFAIPVIRKENVDNIIIRISHVEFRTIRVKVGMSINVTKQITCKSNTTFDILSRIFLGRNILQSE